MFLADSTQVSVDATISTLDGVTTVLVGFFFVCLVLPTMVKHRSQFYAAMACLMGIIAVHTFTRIIDISKFGPFLIGGLQLVAFIFLVLCVGGLTVRELAGDMAKAYEVIRRGETEKEIIIPLADQPPKSVRAKAAAQPNKVYTITEDDDDQDKGIPLS